LISIAELFDFKPPGVEVSFFKGLLFGCLEITLERDLVLDSPGIAKHSEAQRGASQGMSGNSS